MNIFILIWFSPRFFIKQFIFVPLFVIVLIVTTLTFCSDFKDRRGSSKDADSIKELFSKLGFYVEYQKNLTKSKMDK